MGLILPNYLLHERRFKCKRCGFAFIKRSPSAVEKCPMCGYAAYDRNLKPGETLDRYSAQKERWYLAEGQHQEEIRNRKIIEKNGKKVVIVTDNQGRVIEDLPEVPV